MKFESILFISHSGPFPPRDGKRQRTQALLQALSSGYQVDFLIINHESDFRLAKEQFSSESVRFLNYASQISLWERLKHKLGFVFPYSFNLAKYIQSLCSQTDYAFVFSRYIHPVAHIPSDQKIIADIDDDFEEQYKSKIRNAKNLYQRLRLNQIYRLNRGSYKKLLRKLDLAITVKEDKILSNSFFLPNLPFQLIQDNSIKFRENRSDSILFVGKLTYPPNLEGIKWFMRNVFPLVQKTHPNAILTIVSNLDSGDQEFLDLVKANQAIQLKINVENLSLVYQSNALAIAPIFQGAGSNIKVIEALMMGKPIVTSSFGGRGFEEFLIDGLIQFSEFAEDFALKIGELLGDKDKLGVIQKLAFDKFHSNYSLDKWNEKLLNSLVEITTSNKKKRSE